MYNDSTVTTLNFAIVGSVRSGLSLLGEALGQEAELVFHRDVVSDSPGLSLPELEAKRAAAHCNYFGGFHDDFDWYATAKISLNRYLGEKIFDNPQQGETHVGVAIPYSLWLTAELEPYVREWKNRVCWLHLVRNPVASFVSLQRHLRAKTSNTPDELELGLFIDAEQLVPFVREWAVAYRQVERSCEDRLVIPFHELLFAYHRVRPAVWSFLDLPSDSFQGFPAAKAYVPVTRKIISNFTSLRRDLPSDVLSFLQADDFI